MELKYKKLSELPTSGSDPLLLASLVGKLRIIDRAITRHSAYTTELIGLTTTELIFLQLCCIKSGLRLSQIATQMGIHQATSSNIKRNLLKRQLIEESQDQSDLRVVTLCPTQAGRRLAVKAAMEIRSPLRSAAESLTLKQLKSLDKMLALLTTKITEFDSTEDKKMSGESSLP